MNFQDHLNQLLAQGKSVLSERAIAFIKKSGDSILANLPNKEEELESRAFAFKIRNVMLDDDEEKQAVFRRDKSTTENWGEEALLFVERLLK